MYLPTFVLALILMFGAGPLFAQSVFPPAGLTTAPDLQTALATLNAGKPELSTYLLLDVPEIAAAGRIHGRVASEIPGTVYLVVLRNAPSAAGQPVNKQRSSRGAPKAAPKAAPTLLVAAARIDPGQSPTLDFDFELDRPESLTLLAFAQGRWFATQREIKLATLAAQAR